VTWLDVGLALVAAALLGIERACYLAVWRAPGRFRRLLAEWFGPGSDPVTGLANLFVAFKVLQAAVFAAWCLIYGGGRWQPPGDDLAAMAVGTLLIVAGQALNASVFAKLGTVGVFYGNRFGRSVDWRSGFPFSWFRHPQYVGTVATIWGFFLVMRYPAPDWIVLPLIETAYYVAGAWLEDDTAPPVSAG
jgi:methylene-fatty-acyl-phospholipid synthase